ncbi:unnamed protein product [Peniophora sp. CBMAI 1063]|nr:unnamed protein product [Peniophora sp. CBMAI 1063]
MSELDQGLGLQNELELFREKWKEELRERPTKGLALRSARAKSPEPDPEQMALPVVAIWTLPDDLLCEIFYSVAEAEPPTSIEDIPPHSQLYSMTRPLHLRNHFTDMGWLRLTQVCQRWRDILLGAGMAQLWGRVAFTIPSMAAFPTLLSRSKDAPLHALLSAPGMGLGLRAPLSLPHVEAVTTNLHRIRSLKVRSALTRDLLHLFAHPLLVPFLHELDLHVDFSNERRPNIHGPWVIMLPAPQETPEALNDGDDAIPTGDSRIAIDGPSVTVASLHFERTSTSAFMRPGLHFSLPSLRRLEVRIYDISTQISDLDWLMSLLRTAPLIEVLSLELRLRQYTPNWTALFAGSPPQLQYLKELRLKDCRSIDFAPFLGQVCIRPPASISASCSAPRDFDPAVGIQQETLGFINTFGNYLCRPGHKALHISLSDSHASTGGACIVELQSMLVLDDCQRFMYFQGRHTGQTALPQSVNLSADTTQLVFEMPFSHVRNPGWLEMLSSRIGRKDLIEQLDMRIPHEYSHEWVEAFRRHLLLPMTALRELSIVQDTRHTTTAEGWARTINVLLRNSPPLIFPALHTLLVPFCPEVFQHERNPLEAWWNPLIESLTHRQAHGCPIHTLRITGIWTQDWKDMFSGRDARMMVRAMSLVEVVLDERDVHLRPCLRYYAIPYNSLTRIRVVHIYALHPITSALRYTFICSAMKRFAGVRQLPD